MAAFFSLYVLHNIYKHEIKQLFDKTGSRACLHGMLICHSGLKKQAYK